MEFYIAQGISVLTALTAVLMMQFKSMKLILLGQIVANLLAASTYFLLDGLSGAGICFLAIAHTIVMFFYNRKNKQPHISITIIFILLYIACSIYYFKSIIDIFSALAAICFAMSITQKEPAKSRLWYSFNPICWLIYSIFCRAYANCIMYCVIITSTFMAMVRVDGILKPKQKKED